MSGLHPIGKEKILPGTAFILYAIVVGTALYHHELWGDELHSWNIAKASGNYFELLSNIRYEGHPPVWYTLMWVVSKFTHAAYCIQILHFFIALLMSAILLFLSPFPVLHRILILAGYYIYIRIFSFKQKLRDRHSTDFFNAVGTIKRI